MKKSLTVSVLMIIAAQSGVAQTPSPLSFFPHHLDDVWEYVDGPDTAQNVITSDSLSSDGRYYVQTSMFGTYIVDTVTSIVYRTQNGVDLRLEYILGADSGDSWVVFRYGPGIVEIANVVDVYEALFFNSLWKTVKQIDYVDSASGLLGPTTYLASDLGLVGRDMDGFPGIRIRGARINSVLYGTVSSVPGENRSPKRPEAISLYQNFPNPFNPTTTLRYELPQNTLVELTVCDMMGQEVRTLVNTYQQRGNHEVLFDAGGLTSGVYIYRLRTQTSSMSKRMLLIR